ncbi:putative phosphoribosylaminoimidazole-succinocarboxamide synthase [Lineolata rhizophorae]|uniref:Phosphoribosylaminoimidazole-succinocarboxamide synthase n=1 Tax=Lineolata rhizophorae TaxID=578093 RepID=A0A6A6NYK2_9PEZI|nr:putative phosphoribosylaminoimidazole-succinocarboxamide synthase [Lineolata rhizophorae]
MTTQPQSPVVTTDLAGQFPLVARGKVRDVYSIDENTLLFVATDRISAYDVIMSNGIPQKGALLTQISAYWFDFLTSKISGLKTHFLTLSLPKSLSESTQLQIRKRTMQVRRLKVFPIESIVRGYITGSAWNEYRRKGTVNGMNMSRADGAPLQESERLARPIYTPSTKAKAGGKDENIHPDEAARIVGQKYAKRIEELSLSLYSEAHKHALKAGIIIADTKFEFGLDTATDQVVLVDEVLTPDSSRFWPASSYAVGKPQNSFDKQFLRDWLTREGLKGKEGVMMPEEIVRETADKYREAFERLTGKPWAQVWEA